SRRLCEERVPDRLPATVVGARFLFGDVGVVLNHRSMAWRSTERAAGGEGADHRGNDGRHQKSATHRVPQVERAGYRSILHAAWRVKTFRVERPGNPLSGTRVLCESGTKYGCRAQPRPRKMARSSGSAMPTLRRNKR